MKRVVNFNLPKATFNELVIYFYRFFEEAEVMRFGNKTLENIKRQLVDLAKGFNKRLEEVDLSIMNWFLIDEMNHETISKWWKIRTGKEIERGFIFKHFNKSRQMLYIVFRGFGISEEQLRAVCQEINENKPQKLKGRRATA